MPLSFLSGGWHMAERVRKTNAQYKYKISAYWIHGNEETEIESSYISYAFIDRDYDNNNMPIFYMILNLPTTLHNKMMDGQKKDKILMTIKHYNANEKNPADIVDIKGQFYYFMPTNADYNEELAVAEKEQTGIESAYSRVTIGLILPEVINDNRRTINSDIYCDINKATLVYLGLTHVKKLCINNIADKEIPRIAMPTMSSVDDYLEYIDTNFGVYKLGYRYFHDFDVTYLLNESAVYIPNGTKEPKLVCINISSNISDDAITAGMTILDDSYQIDASSSDCVVLIDKNTTTAVSKIVQVGDKTGSSAVAKLDEGEKTEYTRDNRSADRIRYNAKKYEVTIAVTKPYLDDEVFTPNKVYKVLNYDKYRDQDGRYILYRKQTAFENKDGEFVSSTTLNLRKKVEL